MSRLVLLYLHIASALLLMGSAAVSRLAEGGVRGASDLATLRGALDVLRRASRFNPALAVALLASGAFLGRTGWWSAPWFWVAVATWMGNLVFAVRFVVPAHRSLAIAAAQAGDGPVPQEVDALRRAAPAALALDVMIGLDLGTLLLMVSKPAIATAWLWPALGVALVCAVRFVGPLPRATRPAPAG